MSLHSYNHEQTPWLYVLNAAALTKPHAVEHFAADLTGYNADIAVITEIHFKSKHADTVIGIKNYVLHRRDLVERRGGGVVLYVRTTLEAFVWKYSSDDRAYELLWIRVSGVFSAVLYHPPKPLYTTEALLNYIEACVEEVSRGFPTKRIIIAGDMNQLPNDDLVELTGLMQIVELLTRGANMLDRVYVTCPQLYNSVRVITSIVKSDHEAIIAYPDQSTYFRPS